MIFNPHPSDIGKSIDSVPLRRLGTADDFGQVAAVLASPLASYVSGCVVVCDGGQNLAGSAMFNENIARILAAQKG